MWISLSVFISTIIFWCVIKVKRNQSYFERLKIPYLKSPPLLGAYGDVILGKTSIYDKISEIYNHKDLKDEKYFGIFLFHKPALLIKDPDIIKQVLITDFNSFNNRYAASGPHDPIGHYQLFLVKNPLWKTLRSKISPFFSSAKLKLAYYLIEKLGQDFNSCIKRRFDEKTDKVEINLKSTTDSFFIDVIASIAFGLDTKTMHNPDNDFHKATVAFTPKSLWRGLEFSSNVLLPQAMSLFRFKNLSYKLTNYIYEVMPHVFAERVRSGDQRKDLIDTLLEIQKDLVPEFKEHTVQDMMYAQIGIFLGAGFETSSTTTSFTLYELSRNQLLQARVRSELKESLINHDGKITYEMAASAVEMPLLHQTVLETLRKYSVLFTLDRVCTNPNGVSIDDGKFVIPKGMPISIPQYALFRDQKYFDEPLKFDPDRFAADNIKNVPPIIANLAFGAGPRNCIGERLGLIQTKTALIMILKDFRIEENERTPKTIIHIQKAIMIQSQKDLLVDFIKDNLIKE